LNPIIGARSSCTTSAPNAAETGDPHFVFRLSASGAVATFTWRKLEFAGKYGCTDWSSDHKQMPKFLSKTTIGNGNAQQALDFF